MYKVGDLVRILPRDGRSGDYMYSFTEAMLPFVGQVCKIRHISKGDHDGHHCKMNDDGNMYLLEDNGFTWASSMFEPYDSKTKEKSIEEGPHLSFSTQEENYKLNFNI